MKKIWFRRKRYGWGWTPSTVEGWVMTIVYIAAVFVIGANMATDPTKQWVWFGILTVVFLFVAYLKAERPGRWQWGNDRKNTPENKG